MTPVAMEPAKWSGSQWAATVCALGAAHILLVWWLSAPSPRAPDHEPRPPAFHLVSLGASQPSATPWALVDQALFALPNQFGFSGPAWLSLVPVQHQITNWTPPPRLLAPVVTLLGEPFRVFARTSQVAALEVALLPSPPPTDVKAAPEPTLTRSELRVEGDLAIRPLLTLTALPPVANSELLENSVVRIVVDAPGWVRSQALLATSGSRHADQLALDMARSLRFQPLPAGDSAGTTSVPAITRGELVFQWHTLPATNAAPGGG